MKIYFLYYVLIILASYGSIQLAHAVALYPQGIAVVLYTPRTTEYDEGQEVVLLGQVTKYSGSISSGESIVGVPNAPYQIFDWHSGTIITSGYTDQQGQFGYKWIAQRINGQSNLNITAECYGVYSNGVSLEIYPTVNTPPKSYSGNYPTTPEFPFAIPILIISIASLIVFYRIKFR